MTLILTITDMQIVKADRYSIIVPEIVTIYHDILYTYIIYIYIHTVLLRNNLTQNAFETRTPGGWCAVPGPVEPRSCQLSSSGNKTSECVR